MTGISATYAKRRTRSIVRRTCAHHAQGARRAFTDTTSPAPVEVWVSSPPMSRMTSKVWYWVAAGLFLVGTSVVIMAAQMLQSAARNMPRVVMPGKAELVLPVGRSTLYVESNSLVDGKAYRADTAIRYRCSLSDETGKAVPLETSTVKSTYAGGDYAGESAFEVRIATAGTYTLACESSADPFVIAVGGGVDAWIWVAGFGGGVPNGIAALVFLVVFFKRRRQKRAQATAAASGAGSS